ncbi:hypothetical protein NQ318_008760 [Aromia moschata]|uniref:Uncharacterized protein n=1 Tax=Aromia moschata TaxID=1265417 RepID=A0AAV8ZBU9_9CUCU|nr:hypothetical protein NQ318_008760 [Aromia moschata]
MASRAAPSRGQKFSRVIKTPNYTKVQNLTSLRLLAALAGQPSIPIRLTGLEAEAAKENEENVLTEVALQGANVRGAHLRVRPPARSSGSRGNTLHRGNARGGSTSLHSVGVQRFGWPPFLRVVAHLHVFRGKSHVATLLQTPPPLPAKPRGSPATTRATQGALCTAAKYHLTTIAGPHRNENTSSPTRAWTFSVKGTRSVCACETVTPIYPTTSGSGAMSGDPT